MAAPKGNKMKTLKARGTQGRWFDWCLTERQVYLHYKYFLYRLYCDIKQLIIYKRSPYLK